MLRILIIIVALASTISMDAQNEVAGGYIKKGGTESGINATSRFPMYSVMKFPQALYVADFLTRNDIDLNTEVIVRKDNLMQDTWSPMLKTFENQRTFTYSELLALSLQQSDNNACDILFERCGGPRKVEKYIRNLGFKDIRIQKTEKQMHERPIDSNKNWCTPQAMVELLEWFIAHHNDNEPLRYIWSLMSDSQTGGDRLPAAVPSSAKVIHKTGTGYPLPSGQPMEQREQSDAGINSAESRQRKTEGQPSGICDVGIIIHEDGLQFPIAVFITNPSSQSRIAEVAKRMVAVRGHGAIGRLQYVYVLKDVINDRVWQGFADKGNDVPLIYYDESCCYVVNPSEMILNQYAADLVYKGDGVKIYQIKRIDNIPFHMHVTITDEKDRIDYRTPIMRCSSLEQTSKTIPDVNTVNTWATMVMHEYFHGFQFKQRGFLEACETFFSACPQDTLSTLQAQNEWYKESIQQENELLLKAIDAPDLDATKAYIQAFFEIRDTRRTRIKEQEKIDITAAEQLMEIMEGSARYIEYRLYDYFGGFTLAEEKWLYTVGKNYYYATGFNLLRLLDKLGIEYHSRIFTDVTTLEKALKEQ